MDLWSHFNQNTGNIIHKWHRYFPIYEKFFSSYRNKKITFIEIGVFKGGSLQMFAEYFGPLATVVGIDIDKKCKQFESDYMHVRIGDQSDTNFLESVLSEFGTPDIVLDDGSHVMQHVRSSFDYLYPKLSKNGIYMVEDMHTAYWKEYGGGYLAPDSFIEYSKNLIDQLNYQHIREEMPHHSLLETQTLFPSMTQLLYSKKARSPPRETQ